MTGGRGNESAQFDFRHARYAIIQRKKEKKNPILGEKFIGLIL
jgi:hypothetical protein